MGKMDSTLARQASLDGRDLLEVFEEGGRLRRRVIGCESLLTLVGDLRRRHGDDPKAWSLPLKARSCGPRHRRLPSALRSWALARMIRL